MNTALSFSPEITSQLRSKGLEVRELSEEKLPRVIEIEEASYPGDEAATPENLRFRQKFARSFFLEASLDGSKVRGSKIVAFICGTCCQGSELTHDSMSGHNPEGTSLCIHSVAVDEKFRRRGYATLLMKAYLERIAVTQPRVKQVCLIAKAALLGMYASFGFSIKGLSTVVHGQDPWFEMRYDLDTAEPRSFRFLQVDAFTKRAFCGNPAAVFFTHAGGDEYWMQKVAIEMNLSETCFLQLQTCDQPQGTDPTYALRWFTPGGEVSLCGHATLAAAHSLWEEGRVDPNIPIRFSTASGILTCRRDPGDGWISMDFPSEEVGKPLEAQDESRRAVVEALRLGGDDVLFVGRNRLDMLIEVTPEAFAVLEPDMRLLNAIESRGFIVTCFNQAEGVDFRSRFFAPKYGIDEDPVTGSAHCCLGPYWSSKLGRDTLVGYQASPRGGTVSVTVGQGVEGNRVTLKGEAVTVFRGLFHR